jgi:hypothetical protein
MSRIAARGKATLPHSAGQIFYIQLVPLASINATFPSSKLAGLVDSANYTSVHEQNEKQED